jgi:molybdate transport system substrate-binding protein
MLRRFAALLLIALAAPCSAQETLPSIVVTADDSLALPMARITRDYAREHQAAVALSLSGMKEEIGQIAEGSTTDVLITAKEHLLETLKQQGLVDIYSEVAVASDRLVLVGPPDTGFRADLTKAFPTAPLIQLMGGEANFVLGNPETLPDGAIAREALRRMDALADLEPYTLYIRQRAQMNEMILQHNAYGIMLASEARRLPVTIIGEFPAALYPPITYKAVVLAGENMNTARNFIEYLKSPAARDLFKERGLGM